MVRGMIVRGILWSGISQQVSRRTCRSVLRLLLPFPRPIFFCPQSLAICLQLHQNDASVSSKACLRRDDEGGGRDDRAPKDTAKDSGLPNLVPIPLTGALHEFQFRGGGGRVPAARGFAGDGADFLDRNLAAARFRAFDFDVAGLARLLADFLIRGRFVTDK